MKDLKKKSFEDESLNPSELVTAQSDNQPKKGPFSFFSGAFTSFVLAWLCFELSKKMVVYFTLHTPSYSSPIAQSVASGFKTLVIGISFLATFTFSFIGLGLILVLIRSLIDGKEHYNN